MNNIHSVIPCLYNYIILALNKLQIKLHSNDTNIDGDDDDDDDHNDDTDSPVIIYI